MNRHMFIVFVTLTLLLSCRPEAMPDDYGQTTPKQTTISGCVYGNDGKGIEGVVVSDCYKCVKTGKNGIFELDSDLETVKFVFVSIPPGYSAPVRNGLPIFFKRLSEERLSDGKYILEFILNKIETNADRYSLLIAADPQPRTSGKPYDNIAYHSLDCCDDLYLDMREKGAQIKKYRPCYGIMLGDIVHEDMSLYDRYLTNGMSQMGFPTFNVLGNHDNDHAALTDAEGARVFEAKLCPANYSFNIGRIHYVVVDNLIMSEEGGKLTGAYKEGLRDDIFKWLQEDLSYVDYNTTIMICSHAPMFMNDNGKDSYKTAVNGYGYASLLSKYRKVHAWAGHTHVMYNHVYDQDNTLKNIEVHTLVRATGDLWTNEYLSAGGTPRGYVVVDVDGDNIVWQYRPLPYQKGEHVGESPEYLLRAWDYDDNGVAYMKDGGTRLDETYQMNAYPCKVYGDNYVYANVFMWDESWEIPRYISSDGNSTPMTLVGDKYYMYDAGQKELFDFYHANNSIAAGWTWKSDAAKRLFRIYSNKYSDYGRVEVTDRFGNVYSSKISW